MMAFRHRPRSPYGAAMDAIPPFPVPLVQVRDLRLTVPSVAGPVNILRGIDLDVAAARRSGIVGPSGSGKTEPADGAGRPRARRAREASCWRARISSRRSTRTRWPASRRDTIGIVFQAFHLIPTMTALENVAVPLELAGVRDARRGARGRWMRWGSAHRLSTIRASCPAASSSAWRSPGPSPRPAALARRRADRQSRSGAPARQSMELLFRCAPRPAPR